MISHHASTKTTNEPTTPTRPVYTHPKNLNYLGGRFNPKQARELGQFRRMQHIARQRIASNQQQTSPPSQVQETPTTDGGQQSSQPSSNPAPITNRPNVPVTPPVTQSTAVKASPPPATAPVVRPVGNSSTPSLQTGNTTTLAKSPAPPSSTPVASLTTPPSTALRPNQTLPGTASQQSSAQPTPTAAPKELSALQIIPIIASIFVIITVLSWCIAWFHKRARDRLHNARKVEKINIKGPFKKQEEHSADTEPVFGRRDQKRVAFESLEITNEKGYSLGMTDHFSNSPVQPRLISSPVPLPQPLNPAPTILSIHAPDNPMYTWRNSIAPAPPTGTPTLLDNHRLKGPQMEGKVFQVERTYQAVLADELIISVGDRIEVSISYDDGWCLGTKLDIKPYEKNQLTKGVFPRDCVGAFPMDSNKNMLTTSFDYRDSLSSSDQNSRSDFRAISSHPSLSPLNSSIFEKFPIPPGPHRVHGQQRVSSLFVDRNNQLFHELGNALGEPFDSNSPPR